jgi:CsoR family transcriptional regulator, copper-sensing transcriptional repressor
MQTDSQTSEQVNNVLTRLRRVEGQIRGIQRMLEEGRACEDTIAQLAAVRAGLDQATLALLDVHIHDCVLGGVTVEPEKYEQIRQAMRLLARYDSSPLPAARDEPRR